MPLNVTAQNLALDALDETATSGFKFAGVHTLTDPGTGATANAGEATGGSPAYARLANVSAAAASGQKLNTSTFTFDVPAGTYGFFTMWNTLTGNSGTQYLGYFPFGGASAIKGFASIDTTLTNDQFLAPGHGMSNDDRVIVYNNFGGTIPVGLTEGTVYFVVSVATNTFKLSTTSGGSAVDITGLGNGTVFYQRVVPEVFASQGQITVAASGLVLDATAM